MEPWTVILSLWLTTWLMLVWRTYPISMRMISNSPKGSIITKYKYIHFVVYVVPLLVMTPFVWQVAFSDRLRKKWVIAYVNGILGRQK